MKVIKSIYFRYLLSILWTLLIVFLSLGRIKSPSVPAFRIPNIDKLVHFSMYFIYTFCLLFELRVKYKFKPIVWVVLYAIAFGILMEILQATFFAYRSGDVYDAMFNSFGAITMAILFPKINNFIKAKL